LKFKEANLQFFFITNQRKCYFGILLAHLQWN
jgi:hypothetical protein